MTTEALPYRRAALGRWGRFALLANVAPFDVRCMIALIALPAAWKLLSLDFTALSYLCARPPVYVFRPAFLLDALKAIDCHVLSTVPVQALQIACAAALMLFAITRRRLFLAPAVLLLWFLDTTAYLYRGTLYDLDTPLALLTLMLFTPVNLRAASTLDLNPNPVAKIAVVPPLAYVASYYILAGVAKFEFAWNWYEVVRVGNFYPVSYLWHTQVMPPLIDFFARHLSESYRAWPALDTASALVVYIEQFLWLMALFSLVFRVHAGLFAVAYHLTVALTTGIVFVTWLFIPLAVTFPFSLAARKLMGRSKPAPADISALFSNPLLLPIFVVIPVALAVIPSKGLPYPPFHDYRAFGWRYLSIDEFPTIYRLGFWNDRTRKLEAFPLGQGGFLEYKQTAIMGVYAQIAMTLGPDYAAMAGDNLRSMLDGTRPNGANAWALGQLAAPPHLLGVPVDWDMRDIRRFYLIRSKQFFPNEAGNYRVEWEACGEIDRGGPDGAKAVTKFEHCRDDPR